MSQTQQNPLVQWTRKLEETSAFDVPARALAGPVRSAFGTGARGAAWRVRDLVCAEEVRGTGVGAALLRTALTHTVLAGADTVWCHAPGPAAGFYRRHGFSAGGRRGDEPPLLHWSPR